MTQSGFPAGSPMDRIFNLSESERAVVGSFVVQAIQDHGSATIEDFERGIEFVNAQALQFLARLHGGPHDGEEIRMPQEYQNYIGLPELDEPITQEQMDAMHLGEPVDISTTEHGYLRRADTPAPQPGGSADFDYVGPRPK